MGPLWFVSRLEVVAGGQKESRGVYEAAREDQHVNEETEEEEEETS